MTNLIFDADTATQHVSRVTSETTGLTGVVSGAASTDISKAFGIMCSFIATDFMAMADAVTDGLATVQSNLEKANQAMTTTIASFVEDDATSGQTTTAVGGAMGEVNTPAFANIARMN